jgi:nucleotide-binding universal stress UspA family protein
MTNNPKMSRELEPVGNQYNEALQEFRRARIKGDLERLRARFLGRNAQLLSYEDVRRMLRAGSPVGRRELRDIPLDAIVGSVGRYKDFTRNFLPLQDGTASRWANLQIRASGLSGFPPIEVYQIGDAYFIHDGNHRVSVARQIGADHIEAYVTKIETRVPLSPEDDLDDLIIKSEYAEFLEATELDRTRPEANLAVTTPGRYPLMMAQIEVHRQQLSSERMHDVSMADAAADWYDTGYLPTVEIIRERAMLHEFPNRTEADLYSWIHKYREDLLESLGWAVDPQAVAIELPQRFSERPERRIARWGERLRAAITPNLLETGPAVGEWRRSRRDLAVEDRLFRNLLVPIGTQENDWCALEQAIVIAREEGSYLHGLHIVADPEEAESERGQYFRRRFKERCQLAGVSGEMAIVVGATDVAEVMATLSERARWVDLVVVCVDRPPEDQPLARLGSSIGILLRRSPRPVLTVPSTERSIQSAILAYDGSEKAEEALYVAAYLATHWQLSLTVVSVLEGSSMDETTLQKAKTLLSQQRVNAEFVAEQGEVASVLLSCAAQKEIDLFIMGGYGLNPLLEVVLGSTVDEILRTTNLPVLVCR